MPVKLSRLVFTLFCATLALLSVAAVSSLARQANAQAQPQAQRIRIGIYDSRAVAVAFGRSDAFLQRTRELHQQYARAKESGDQKTADRIQKQGRSLQVRRHLQAFSNAPVDEILADVNGQLPAVAQKHDVVAIVASTNFGDAARVEIVDVTDDLVMLFNPDEKTLSIIDDLSKQTPLPIEEVAMMDHKKH